MKKLMMGLMALCMAGCSVSPVSQRALLDQCKGLGMDSVVYFHKNEVKRITCVPKPKEIKHKVELAK